MCLLAGRPSIAGRPATWIVLGVAVALALRAPWLAAPLGRDEGGLALVARAWHHSGSFAYGDYFVDRPPLLVALFRLADTPLGVRILGAICAAAAVAIAVAIALRLGGPRAAPAAGLVSAVLVSSVALGSVFTPAELVAIVPSSASVLILLIALDRPGRGWALFCAAGALAALALLVKQSFGGALLCGCAVLAALAWKRRPAAGRALAYLAGAASVLVALELYETTTGLPAGSVSYAILGFRLDALGTLADSRLAMKLERLPLPALGSGLALALLLSVLALRRLRAVPIGRTALGAWLVGSALGVAAGGSYWAHYLIALAPPAAVGTGVLLARAPRWRTLALVGVTLPAVAVSAFALGTEQPRRYQRDAVTVATYVRERARPEDTAYVLYARANVLYYSGLRSPFPYHWSLLVRAAPGARAHLRALLASPQRPTWIVKWHAARAFGLDPDGRVGRLIERHYHHRATVCGRAIYVRDGVRRPRLHSLRPGPRPCDAGFSTEERR